MPGSRRCEISRVSGERNTLTVACVTMPNTPSAPMKSGWSAGPAEVLGMARVRMVSPVGSTTSSPSHLLAHRAVPCGAVADAVGGDGAAQGGNRHGVWVVSQHQALASQRVVQVTQHHARLRGCRAVLRADAQDAIHAAHVHGNAAVQGRYGAGDARSASEWHQRETLPVGQLDSSATSAVEPGRATANTRGASGSGCPPRQRPRASVE